jgi:hypothetical protein
MDSNFTLRQEMQQLPPSLPEVEILQIRVEWMRYCGECDVDRRFVADRRCSVGLIAVCSVCGDERLVRFTRVSTCDPWEAWT